VGNLPDRTTPDGRIRIQKGCFATGTPPCGEEIPVRKVRLESTWGGGRRRGSPNIVNVDARSNGGGIAMREPNIKEDKAKRVKRKAAATRS